MGGQDTSGVVLYTAPLLLGCLFSYFLAGCAFIQGVHFFQTTRLSKRHAYSIILVSTVSIVEVVSLVMAAIGSYHILCVAIPRGDFSFQAPPVALGLLTLNTFITVCVQGHFALRIRMLLHQHWAGNAIAIIVVVLGLTEVAASVGITYFSAIASGDLGNQAHDIQVGRVLKAWFISTALGDIVTSLALVHIYLGFRKHTERRQSKSWLNSLIRHTLENGAITSLGAILHFVFFTALPNSLIHLAIAYVTARLYSNVLFASINANRRVQRDIMTHSGTSVSLPHPSTGNAEPRVARARPGSAPSAQNRSPSRSAAIRQGGLIGTKTESVEFTRIESSMLSASGNDPSLERSI